MELKIQQWGNSAAVRLPVALLKKHNLACGDLLAVSDSGKEITLRPVKTKPRYRLADLMAQCDLTAPEPTELSAWNTMQSVGREA